MKHFSLLPIAAGVAAISLLGPLAATAQVQPFTAGNVVVVRIGDGVAPLSSAATATALLEYTPAGALVQTIALPTAASGANSSLTNTGTSTSDALLTRSVDGRYLVLTGYDAAVGTASLTNTSSATNNRIIGRVAANGTVDTSTRLNDAFSGTMSTGANIRSAATVDGSAFYAVGSAGGVRYVPFANSGTAPTVVLTTAPGNNRGVGIYGGNLYVSSATGTGGNFFGVTQVGTGLPTTAPQTATPLPGFPTASGPSAYGFYFADLSATVPGVDVVYVADDRSTTEGGIQKWSLVAGTWTLNGTIGTSATPAPALRGLDGRTTGSTVSLVASGGSSLFVLSDNAGYNAAPSTGTLPTAIATPAANMVFRGATFAPVVVGAATRASQALPGLTVSPNPATDVLTVALPRPGAATVALRDLTGRLVLAPAALAADQQLHLPAGLAAGVYLLEVQQGAATAVRRVEKN